MPTLSLNALAASSSAWNGAVIFHMLPFTAFSVDAHQAAFDAIFPRYRYQHAETGATQMTVPPEYATALELAKDMTPDEQKLLAPFEGVLWERIDQWNAAAKAFAMCEPLTLGVELVDENAPSAAKAVVLYMQERGQGIEADWALFQQCIGADAVDQWGQAYGNTRDKKMRAPAFAQETPGAHTNPKSSSGGKPTPPKRSKASGTSRKRSSSSTTPKA